MDRRRLLLTARPRARAALLVAVLLTSVTLPPAAAAQESKIHRVALLIPFSTAEAQPYRTAFLEGMRALGYSEGRNVFIEVRTSDRDRLRVPALVDELLALKPDVFVSDGNAAAVLRSKTTIPVVLATSTDPVGSGLAQSWRRPGLNFTGVAVPLDQLAAKHIEIMREIRSPLARVALLVDTTGTTCKVIEDGARQAARSLGAALTSYPVANRSQIEQAFVEMKQAPPDLLLPCPAAMLFDNRDLLFDSAVRLRIPFSSFAVGNVPEGVLFAYSASFTDGYGRAATYVDRILKGARPGDLPIEQPTKFDFIINLKTAKALGLAIPPSVLLRADQVIE
jgi:putative ABC transport system substrate-binding protein